MPVHDCWRLLASGLRKADANFGSLRKRIEATCHASSERRSRFETSVREAQSTGRELDGLSDQTTSQQASMPREGCEEVPSRQPTKRPACHPERTLQMISCFMLCRFADSQQSRACTRAEEISPAVRKRHLCRDQDSLCQRHTNCTHRSRGGEGGDTERETMTNPVVTQTQQTGATNTGLTLPRLPRHIRPVQGRARYFLPIFVAKSSPVIHA